jgi:membrane-bound inhibitor of C-type lysozyme
MIGAASRTGGAPPRGTTRRPYRRVLHVLAVASRLTGCAASSSEPHDVTALDGRARIVAFACEDGARFTVGFTEDSALLTTPDGTATRLARQPTASGILYRGDGHVLRGKGAEVTWTDAGATPHRCRDASKR